MSQPAVYLGAHCHLDQIIVDVAVYDRALCQFEALSSMDIAFDLTVNHGVGDFDFTRYFSALDNPQDGVLSGLGCNTTDTSPSMSKLPLNVMSPLITVPGDINVVLPDAVLLTIASLRVCLSPLFLLPILFLIIALYYRTHSPRPPLAPLGWDEELNCISPRQCRLYRPVHRYRRNDNPGQTPLAEKLLPESSVNTGIAREYTTFRGGVKRGQIDGMRRSASRPSTETLSSLIFGIVTGTSVDNRHHP